MAAVIGRDMYAPDTCYPMYDPLHPTLDCRRQWRREGVRRVGMAEVRQSMNGGVKGHIRSYLIGRISTC